MWKHNVIKIEVKEANVEVQEKMSSELRIAMPWRLTCAQPHIAVEVVVRFAYGL